LCAVQSETAACVLCAVQSETAACVLCAVQSETAACVLCAVQSETAACVLSAVQSETTKVENLVKFKTPLVIYSSILRADKVLFVFLRTILIG